MIAGPTRPRISRAWGDTAWRLISHLTLNYLSLTDSDALHGAAALRELLGLYADPADATHIKQIEGLRSIAHGVMSDIVVRTSGLRLASHRTAAW